jgi:hypothetical protein
MQGDDHPGSISVFHNRFVSALKWMGGSAFSGAIPDAFGPLNCNQYMDSGSVSQEFSDRMTANITNRSVNAEKLKKRKYFLRERRIMYMTARFRFLIQFIHFDINSN